MHRLFILGLLAFCAGGLDATPVEIKYDVDLAHVELFKAPARCFSSHPDGFGSTEPIDLWYFQDGFCHEFEYHGGEDLDEDENMFKTKAECLFTCKGDPCLKSSQLNKSWVGGAYKNEETGSVQFCSYAKNKTDNCPNGFFCSLDGPKDNAGVCCHEETTDACLLPKLADSKIGEKNYYYDLKSNTCKDFLYSGMGGNQNRFTSLELCNKACVKKDICPSGNPYSKQMGPVVCDANKEANGCPAGYNCIFDKRNIAHCCLPVPTPSPTGDNTPSSAAGKSFAALLIVLITWCM